MIRIGHGFDVHQLVEGRKCIIGGVDIPHEKGLKGHSDADVLLHAVCDALLGAAALGDIGKHFPDTDPRFKGIDSRELLRHVAALINEKGYRVVNVDATVIAEAPRVFMIRIASLYRSRSDHSSYSPNGSKKGPASLATWT